MRRSLTTTPLLAPAVALSLALSLVLGTGPASALDEEKERKRYVHSACAIAQQDEVYYDPDDGLPYDYGTGNVDDRMNYFRYGPELTAYQSGKWLSFGLKIKGQLWNYEDTELLPEYDHEYMYGSLYGQFKFTSTALLRVTGDLAPARSLIDPRSWAPLLVPGADGDEGEGYGTHLE